MSKIAIIGANGILGKPTIEALTSEAFSSKVSFPIIVISTSGKSPVTSDKIEVVSSSEGYKGLFAGVDAVVNLAGPPGCVDPRIIEELVASNVKLYIPSQFGTDLSAAGKTLPGFLSLKSDHSKAARSAGIKTVDVYNALFIRDDQTFMGAPFSVLNFDEEKKEVEIVGDDNTPINPTFESDVGKVVAALVTRGEYADIPDEVRVYSDTVTLGDLVAHNEKKGGVKFTKKYSDPQKIIVEALVKYQNFSFDDFLFYLKTFIALGEGKGIIFEKKNEREFVNPGESLFKWKKYVI